MKLLVVGDFQGFFPKKMKDKLKKEDFDFVIGVGDYTGVKEWRPYIMKSLSLGKKGKRLSAEEYFGKKRYKKLLKRDYDAGINVLRELKKLAKPTIIVFGNGDWHKYKFDKLSFDIKRKYDNVVKKIGLRNITYGKTKFNEINFIGFGGYMDIDAYFDKKEWKDEDRETYNHRIMRRNKGKKHLFNLLRKVKGEKIFVLHYPPKGAFDIIRDKKDNPMNGKSAGIGFFNEAIKRYNPKLVLCGHMHEYQGMKRLGKSIVVNPGDAEKGKYAIVDWPSLKVKFVR